MDNKNSIVNFTFKANGQIHKELYGQIHKEVYTYASSIVFRVEQITSILLHYVIKCLSKELTFLA